MRRVPVSKLTRKELNKLLKQGTHVKDRLSDRTEALENLSVEMYARGLSTVTLY